MSRRLLLTMLTGSSAVQTGCNALGALAATLLVGVTERGAMVVGVTIGSVAVILGGLGTGSALRARLPAAAPPSRRALVAAFSWWSLGAAVLAAAGAAAGSVVSAPLVDPILAQPSFVLGVAATTMASFLLVQQTEAWFAAGRFRAGGLGAAAGAGAGLLGLLGASVLSGHAWSLLLGQAVATAVVVLVVSARLRAAQLFSLARPAAGEIVGLIRLGVPVLGATIGYLLAMRADRFIIGSVAGAAAVAVYSLAATLSEFPRMLSSAVGQLLLRDIAVGAGRPAPRRAARLAIGLTSVAGVVVALAGIVLIGPVFGAEFAGAPAVLVPLLGAEVCLAPYALAIRGLVGGGWTGAAGLVGALGGAVGIGLFLVLVPAGGLAGAAVACVVLYLGLSMASWWLLERRLATVAVRAPARRVTAPATATPATGEPEPLDAAATRRLRHATRTG